MRPTNHALNLVSRRAERSTPSQLLASYVDVGDLSATIQGADHQVMYGRRGTGKTHILTMLASAARERGEVVVQCDLRTLGSTGGIYSDTSLPIAERATRLLSDLLWELHDGILSNAIDDVDVDLKSVQLRLDSFAASISDVRVIGSVTEVEASGESDASVTNFGLASALGVAPSLDLNFGISDSSSHDRSRSRTVSGNIRHRVHFGSVARNISDLSDALGRRRVLLLLDEWSEVPLDLQPYLSDLLRRTVFPAAGITVKIAAIEQRTNFRIPLEDGGYIGIEIGADGAPSLTLDDYMVFDNDAHAATAFIRKLLWRHAATTETPGLSDNIPEDEFTSEAFTQVSALQELARAAEGVPRDAINIAALAARSANDEKISVAHVRSAARQWYQQSKENAISPRQGAVALLSWIVERVIRGRRARAFLLPTTARSALIDFLYDARVLHVIKKSVSSNDTPGVRYNVFAIDYGCYVDLISTANAPAGLFQVGEADEDVAYVDVPTTDYRSIRRAILDLAEFANSIESA